MPPGDCIATAVPQSYSFLTGDQDGLEIWDLRTLAELPPTIDGPWLLPVTGTLLDGPQVRHQHPLSYTSSLMRSYLRVGLILYPYLPTENWLPRVPLSATTSCFGTFQRVNRF